MSARLSLALLAATLLTTPATTHARAQAPAAPATTPARPATAEGAARPRPTPPRESLRAIRERGVLRACVGPTAPWVIEAPDGQQARGFAVDVARQLAEDLGVELALVRTNTRELMADLFEGECDVIPGGLAPTPDRALFLHFTTPIAEHDVEAVTLTGGAATLEALDAAGIVVGAVEGSAEFLDARRRLPKAEVRTFESQAALGDALFKKAVQAVVVAEPFSDVVSRLAGNTVVVVGTPLARRRESIAVRRGDLEFLAYLNTWVQARTDDGWLAGRVTAWFDTFDWAEGK